MSFYMKHAVWLLAFLMMAGCTIQPQDPGALTGPATHVGTGVVLRVDSKKTNDVNMRFVPVLHKGDVRGLLTPDAAGDSEQKDEEIRKREILSDEWIQISLRSAYIRYLKEAGKKNRKGEIIILVSFHSGSEVRDKGFVVYSSTGQTLSSSLNIGEWPIIGPVRIDSDNFLMRVVVLEVDSKENKQLSEALNMATDVAGTAAGANPLVKQVAQESLDLLITLNTDDIVLDERFGLRKKQNDGWDYNHTPLLTGTYIILQQEDRLQGSDVIKNATSATYPPNVDRMFFDTHSKNLYRSYHFTGDAPVNGIFESEKDYHQVEQPNRQQNYMSLMDAVLSTKDKRDNIFDALNVSPDDKNKIEASITRHTGEYSSARLKKNIETLLRPYIVAKKMEHRSRLFGYPKNFVPIGNNISGSYDDTMREICRDSYRGDCDDDGKCKDLDSLYFDFPVEIVPKANMALVQYPIHTHIILSVERVSGNYKTKYHDLYQAYDEYIEQNFKPLLGEKFNAIAETMTKMKRADERINITFEQVDSKKELAPKVKLMKDLLMDLEEKGYDFKGTDNPVVSSVYNKLYRLTGEWFSDAASINPGNYEKFVLDAKRLAGIDTYSKESELRPFLIEILEKNKSGIPVNEALDTLGKKIGSAGFNSPSDFERHLKKQYIEEQLGPANEVVTRFATDQGPVKAVDFVVKVLNQANERYPIKIETDNYIKAINEQLINDRIVSVAEAEKWVIDQQAKEKQRAHDAHILNSLAELRKRIRAYINDINSYAATVKTTDSSAYAAIEKQLKSAEAEREKLDTARTQQELDTIEDNILKIKQDAQDLAFPPQIVESDAN